MAATEAGPAPAFPGRTRANFHSCPNTPDYGTTNFQDRHSGAQHTASPDWCGREPPCTSFEDRHSSGRNFERNFEDRHSHEKFVQKFEDRHIGALREFEDRHSRTRRAAAPARGGRESS
jgi:hypothetical protein